MNTIILHHCYLWKTISVTRRKRLW